MKYAKGIMWLSDTRIPFVDENINFDRPRIREKKDWVYDLGTTWENPDVKEYNQQGRFTPNLLVCDDMLNDGIERKSDFNPNANLKQYSGGSFGGGKTNGNNGYGDKGSASRFYDLDKWFEKIIDEIQ